MRSRAVLTAVLSAQPMTVDLLSTLDVVIVSSRCWRASPSTPGGGSTATTGRA